jgi:hypothetical protein
MNSRHEAFGLFGIAISHRVLLRHRVNRGLRLLIAAWTAWMMAASAIGRAADPPDYSVVDSEIRLERIDSSPSESFLSMRCDSAGRMFVGGRDALFVYEPTDSGGFQPRRELLRFPPHSWVYDIEVRGNDLYVLTLSALYRVPDGVVKRQGLRPERLLWGIPRYHVHQCFHALAWGPEGDLYISMGDTLVHYGDFNRPFCACGPTAANSRSLHADCGIVAASSSITTGTSLATTTITSRSPTPTFPAG